MSSVAMTLTVKNERDLLRNNILYHRFLGVDKFYIFLDNTTDDTAETVGDLDCVHLSPSIEVGQLRERTPDETMLQRPRSMRAAIEQWGSSFMARQLVNVCMAILWAGKEEHDWLIAIDADELVTSELENPSRGELAGFLGDMDPEIEQVTMVPLEVVQQNREYDNVFAEATLFKESHGRQKRDFYDPLRKKRKRYFLSDGGHFTRPRRFSWWYGHKEGKSAVRTSADGVPASGHRFVRLDGTGLCSLTEGYVLHYLMYNENDFLKKYDNFINHPERYVSGHKVDFRKRVWRDMVGDPRFSKDDVRQYYREWIAADDETVERKKSGRTVLGFPIGKPDVIEVTGPQNVFTQIANQP